MSDPKRWAEEDSASTALEQDLFRAGRSAGMPLDEKRQRWASIAEQVALVALASAPPSRGGAGPGGVANTLARGWLKALSTLALLAGAGAGTWVVAHRRAPVPTRVHAPVPTTTVVSPTATSSTGSTRSTAVANESTAEGALEVAPRPRSAPVVPGRATAPADRSHLAEEARAVLDAHTALVGGNPSAALELLDAARVDFPHGSLGQEREALAIEALAASGQKDAASARARSFLLRFPGSPHAATVRRFVEP